MMASPLSERDRDVLLGLGGVRRFERGERLMRQGEPGDRVLVLLSGHVKTSCVDSRGHHGAVIDASDQRVLLLWRPNESAGAGGPAGFTANRSQWNR